MAQTKKGIFNAHTVQSDLLVVLSSRQLDYSKKKTEAHWNIF